MLCLREICRLKSCISSLSESCVLLAQQDDAEHVWNTLQFQYFCFHYSLRAELLCFLCMKYEDMEYNWVAMFVCRHLSIVASFESSSECGTHLPEYALLTLEITWVTATCRPTQRDAMVAKATVFLWAILRAGSAVGKDKGKGKGKGLPVTYHTGTGRGSRGIALLILILGARWRWAVNATPRPLYPRCSLSRRLCVPLGRSGRVMERDRSPAIGVRTPNCRAWSASCYTYCTIPAPDAFLETQS